MMQNLREEIIANNIPFILTDDYFNIDTTGHLWAFSLFFSILVHFSNENIIKKNKLLQENAAKRKWCVLLMCLDSPVYFNEGSKSTANVDQHRHINGGEGGSILGYAQFY